jgi:hypothetical protein
MATQVRPPQIDLQMGGDQRHRLPAVDRNEHPIPQILRVTPAPSYDSSVPRFETGA